MSCAHSLDRPPAHVAGPLAVLRGAALVALLAAPPFTGAAADGPGIEAAGFDAAAGQGRVAAVVDRHRPNLFETRIASIGPGETVAVTLDVLLPVAVDDGVYRLVLPTTLTPRYTDAAVPDAAALDSPVLPASRTHGPRVRLAARVAGTPPAAVTSPTHRLSVHGDAAVLAAPSDRDIAIEWPFATGTDPGVQVHVGERAGARYVQLLLEPPARRDANADAPPHRRPRELVIVLDRSGSMAGEPMRAARAAVESALDRLGPRDTSNVIAFDDRVSEAFDAPRAADARAVADARDFVRRIDADGGTEIRPALERAIATTDPERLVQIVFVTDGAIGYEDALLADLEASLGGRRLFAVGIGAAPNRWFLDKAATLGRGAATFVADVQGVEAAIGELLDELAAPVLTDLVASVAHGSVRLYPDPVPDLCSGRPVMLLGRLTGDADEVFVTGRRDGERWRRAYPLLPHPSRPHRRRAHGRARGGSRARRPRAGDVLAVRCTARGRAAATRRAGRAARPRARRCVRPSAGPRARRRAGQCPGPLGGRARQVGRSRPPSELPDPATRYAAKRLSAMPNQPDSTRS